MSRRAREEIARPAAKVSAAVAVAEEPFALRLEVTPVEAHDVAAFGTRARAHRVPHPQEAAGLEPAARTPPAGAAHRVVLEDALVVPAGALLRGRVCARALLLAGEIVGTVHCGTGPVVIRAGASLKGQLIAGGDVHVCGAAIDYAGGTVITTPVRLVLAPGARVEGDVRSGRLEIHEGATLNGKARGFDR